MIAKGKLKQSGLARQPSRTVSIKSDGTSGGTIEYHLDKSNIGLLPPIHSTHPDEPTLIAQSIDVTYQENGVVSARYTYHGISPEFGGISRPTVDFDGGVDQIPIQLHPKFATFAGSASSPKNGAKWVDPVTQAETKTNEKAEFLGFYDPNSKFFGVEMYLVSRPVVTRTYWKSSAPNLTAVGKIVGKVPGVTNPSGIKNWLCVGASFSQVGRYYKIVEQYKGSPDPGWNADIYT